MAFTNVLGVPFNREQIAILISPGQFGGGHIGIGFHSAKAGPQVLHLAWHQRLLTESIPMELKACWIADAFPAPPSASKQIVAMVRAISVRTPSINFGINFISAKGSFATNGAYKPPKGSDGLTCATFVVEVLRACAVNLLKIDNWQTTEANVAWGNAVCAHLAAVAEPSHVEAVRKNINGLRVIPFEVAGAATLGPRSWPADFSSVQQPSVEVSLALTAALDVA